MKRVFPALVLLFFVVNIYAQVPPKKQTKLGLYVTAKEAFVKYQKDKKHVKVLDVRTPAEYVYVGHAPMAYNIPVRFMTGIGEDGKPLMQSNRDFIRDVKAKFKPSDTILVMCRSGHRSAAAIDLLSYAGFKKLYQIVDGFEGDKLKDPHSPKNGKRVVNGWKNSGLPWTYHLNLDLVYEKMVKK